tara:strand:- start:3674 stop:4102 length:429 start_codon:yes stop_codon:yes gene_type:complete
MIKYCLICKNCDLTFESWFASSKEYEKLKKKNFLSCHNCSSKNVEKSLMAPNLINNKTSIKANKEFKKYNQIKKKIFEYQKFIKDNLKYVGDNFAHEARTIHYNEKKQNKGIYGTASNQDLKELKEEGIDAQIIPWVDDKNN